MSNTKLIKPTPKYFGYQDAEGFADESGWMIEGGEDAYYDALEKWRIQNIQDAAPEMLEALELAIENINKWNDFGVVYASPLVETLANVIKKAKGETHGSNG